LRVAEKFAHVVFSASGASFRLETRKLYVLNHGIDTDSFRCPERKGLRSPLRIMVVGRVTPIKGQVGIIEAMRELKELGVSFMLTIIGEPTLASDAEYADKLKRVIERSRLGDRVVCLGGISHEKVAQYYCGSDITLNMVPTGGLDKTVLEAMAAGAIPLTSNEAFREHFGEYADVLIARRDDPKALARQVESIIERGDIGDIRSYLIHTAREKFDVTSLIERIRAVL